MMIAVVSLASVFSLSNAAAFLESRESDHLADVEIKDTLLSELYDADGNPRIQDIMMRVQPMYDSLPKNKHGRLDPSTVKYAVHRYFVQRYGWSVSGLDPTGVRNASVAGGIMKERASSFVESLFEDILGEQGFGIKELSVFAATVADLIHDEAALRLDEIHDAFKFGKSMSQQQSDMAIKVYLAEFLLGTKVRTRAALRVVDKSMWEAYPDWDSTLMWAKDMRGDFQWRQVSNPFVKRLPSFTDNALFLHNIKERFNSYQNLECQKLKSSLLEIEHAGTGRVRLNNFYSGGMGGDWKFTESVAFLRNLGVLDETDLNKPSVVIPNYLLSKTNCMSSSRYFAVCCVDECETLMSGLEISLARPSATPTHIASIVSKLASDTVEAPRNLSSTLLGRLDDIATVHGGLVPLHGRLFAQWMHHAYPRECAFPHVGGAVNPLTPDEWLEEFGTLEATMDDMIKHNKTTYNETGNGVEADALPWTMEEELVAVDQVEQQTSGMWSTMRPIMAMVALASLVSPLVRVWSSASKGELAVDRMLV
jgi:hypothetical protein